MWYPSKSDFIAKLVESTNAELRVTKREVLGKSETEKKLEAVLQQGRKEAYPLQAPVLVSIMAFDVSTLPNRAAYAASVSSSVSG